MLMALIASTAAAHACASPDCRQVVLQEEEAAGAGAADGQGLGGADTQGLRGDVPLLVRWVGWCARRRGLHAAVWWR